jgi:UPF0716 protein FxsA
MRVRWIPLVLLVTAIIEVVAFVLVANAIGWGWAVLLVIATSILGSLLMRREGVRAWTRFRNVAAAGERPGPHLTRAFIGLMGAFLLMVPGFVTDVIGAALLLPPVRAVAGRAVAGFASRRLPSATMGEYFGPRRVRVKVGKPTPGGSASEAVADDHLGTSGPVSATSSGGHGDTTSTAASGAEILEGEIIDPR